jgi:tripartite-type tricarboxylate transporter receptor subunit TctC
MMKDVLPGYPPDRVVGQRPSAVVDKLNGAIRNALQVPAVANVMQRDGYMPDGRSAAETATFFHAEVKRMGGAVKAAGIEPN